MRASHKTQVSPGGHQRPCLRAPRKGGTVEPTTIAAVQQSIHMPVPRKKCRVCTILAHRSNRYDSQPPRANIRPRGTALRHARRRVRLRLAQRLLRLAQPLIPACAGREIRNTRPARMLRRATVGVTLHIG
jgi:hypothetical protein